MVSLADCIKKHGKALSQVDIVDLKSMQKEYRDEGNDPQKSSVLALNDAIQETIEDVVSEPVCG